MTTTNKTKIKKVILHIGSEKTGSTSIQMLLRKSQKLLLSNGILYPSTLSHDLHHAIFCSCFTAEADLLQYNLGRDRIQVLLERDKGYLCAFEKLLLETHAHTVILSYEGFWRLTEDSLNEVRAFLENYCDEIKIVFYARPPLAYAKSAMSQRVKMGRRVGENDDLFFVNYQDILDKFGQVFGKSQIDVRLFSKETLPAGNVVLDFLSLLNLPKRTAEKVIRKGRNRNASLSQEAWAIGDRIAELLDGYVPPNEFNNKRAFGLLFLPAIKGQKFQLTDSQQKTILELTEPQTEYLAREFGINIQERLHTGHKPLRISKDTVDYTARALLRLLVPEFNPPTETPAPNGCNLDRCFIIKVMLKTKVLVIALPAYRRLRSVQRRFN
ncbi:MAG: hypothetical protein HRT90_08285 [Candidatus Margulisbacteria bacterium]|nr:hypothetical protein [Candidatus Margulisiibacteriota bacterium]